MFFSRLYSLCQCPKVLFYARVCVCVFFREVPELFYRKMDTMNSETMMQQAQHIWSMLDDMAEHDPKAYKRFIEKQKAEQKEYTSPPEPHMCVQTQMTVSTMRGQATCRPQIGKSLAVLWERPVVAIDMLNFL